jgi:hypothetical protein
MQVSIKDRYSRHCFTHKKGTAILRALNTPLASSLADCLRDENYRPVISAAINPDTYECPDRFAKDYLAVSLLRKYANFPLGIDTANVAIVKFLESEEACGQTNKTRVRPYVIHDCGLTPESYISYARFKIKSLLGEFDWNKASERFSFSGGASTRLKRKSGAPFYKFQGKPETTRNNALLSVCAIKSIPLWAAHMESQFGPDAHNWVKVVEGSKVTTVAKTAETDRCIAIEPDMNMFIQKGIGSLIRSALRSAGIDLNDQTLNQKLAKIGSTTGSLSTIDLASASDSIALELVRLLLPHDWFEAMCLCRSEYGILPNGVKHRFEKISSMGNGYTFELESLIFWALSKAVIDLTGVSDRRLGVYGDDLIIHNSVADILIDLLAYCGFTTNKSKTFLSGPFRESCGKHYFYGEDVTPFYIKSPLDALNRRYWVGNSLRTWASSRKTPSDFQSVYDYIVNSVPRHQRYRIPVSLGSESGFWATFEEAVPRYHMWKQAYSLKLLRSSRDKHRPDGYAAVLHYFNSNVNGGEGVSTPTVLEKGETRYYHSKVYLSWWDAAPCGVVLRSAEASKPRLAA